jgi:hypothetical protein
MKRFLYLLLIPLFLSSQSTTIIVPVPEAQIPSGTIDGINKIFTLTNVPMVNTQLVFLNGLTLFPGAGDYLISGSTITFTGTIPQPGDKLIVQYWVVP